MGCGSASGRGRGPEGCVGVGMNVREQPEKFRNKSDLGSKGVWGSFLTIILKAIDAISSVHIYLTRFM